MWFIVIALIVNGQLGPADPSIATWRFPTHAACMASAKARAQAMRTIAGAHGRYLCMYHGESDAEMTRRSGITF
jgi:hypothetical protein